MNGGEPALWRRRQQALADTSLPAAFVDLDAFDANVARLMSLAGKKPVRIATKSLRCPDLIRRVVERGGSQIVGLMTYTATELAFLARQEFAHDFLLAYPTVQTRDLDLLAQLNRDGVLAATVADAPEHLEALNAAAQRAGTTVPVVIDVDAAWTPLGLGHVGVRRSPLRSVRDVVAFAQRVTDLPHLRLRGLMAYEAQIAGLPDRSEHQRWQTLPRRFLKWRSRLQLERQRAQLAALLRPALFNGGGTGSLAWSAAQASLTEVTIGSGFLDSHLFDGFGGLGLAPAAFFALPVVRRASPDVVTCLGGGCVASGEAGPDRLPKPCWPPELALLPREGAGEVQTPLRHRADVALAIGDVVFFRHAKAGELAEHFNDYILLQGCTVVGRAQTYRGLGEVFLG